MPVTSFFTEPRLHIVAGKGGVGKTTITAALALTAARCGLDVLVVDIEGRAELPALLGGGPPRPLGFEEVVLRPADPARRLGVIRARGLTAEQALIEYLGDHGLRRLARTMLDTGVIEVIARGAPGMKDILVLGKIKQLERATEADVILVDAPASGHAITFLRSPRGLLDAVRLGPIHHQAAEVLELLTDGTRCQVILATLAEETPVNEVIETAFSLEEDIGIKLGPVVVNGLYPPLALPNLESPSSGLSWPDLAAAARFRTRRQALQDGEVARLAAQLPLPQLRLPFQFTPAVGSADLEVLADELTAAIDDLPATRPIGPTRRQAAGRATGPSQPPPAEGDRPSGPEADAAPSRLADIVAAAQVLVCAGSGGVGKTTTAATLATEGARRGRRAVVVTIDPARRLADALGLGQLTNEPRAVAGPWSAAGGSLAALMLDTKSTFDDLVARYAASGAQRDRILGNRFYRNISNALSGTQEYMAAEKLFELHSSGDYDLIVVDTPPTRNALDVLDAPNQLARLLDHRVYRVLTAPGRGMARVVNRAAQGVVRAAARVVGAEVIDDAVAFFAAFEGMEAGFRERSERVQRLLGSAATAFVLVASPRPDTVAEATYFASRLEAQGLAVGALVVNRTHPSFGGMPADAARVAADAAGGPATPLGALWSNLADFRAVAAREEDTVATLARRVAPAPVVRVQLLDDDVHDLDGLARIGRYLFAAP